MDTSRDDAYLPRHTSRVSGEPWLRMPLSDLGSDLLLSELFLSLCPLWLVLILVAALVVAALVVDAFIHRLVGLFPLIRLVGVIVAAGFLAQVFLGQGLLLGA